MRTWIRILVVGVSLFAAAAQGAEDPFNVDCFFGWGGCYRPMEWTSVEVGINSQLRIVDNPFPNNGQHLSAGRIRPAPEQLAL